MKVSKVKNQNSVFKLSILFFMSFVFVANSQTFDVTHYINNALAQSPLLQKQENNSKIIALNLKQFNAIYKSPKINFNSNILFAPILSKDGATNKLELTSSGSNNYIGYDLGASNGGQYQAMMSVNQPLFTNKYYKAQEDRIGVINARNSTNVQLTKIEIKQLVTHQYILCIQSKEQENNTLKTIQIIKEQVEQMKMLVKSGIYKLVDLKLLEIELQNNEIENERLKSDYLTNFNALNLVCGIKDATLYNLDEIQIELSLPIPKSSLFSTTYKLDSLAVKAEQRIVNLNYLPQINAFGDAGLNATYSPSFNRLGFSVGISLNWNLFDGHQKQFKKEESQLLLENIGTDKKYYETQNIIRKNNILSQINSLDTQINLMDTQLIDYTKLLELYKLELKNSLVSVLELKTLIKDITIKQQEKINALMSKKILINSYNYWNN